MSDVTPRSALVLIDMANDFVHEGGTIADAGGPEYRERAKAIIPGLARLVEAAREAGVLVVYATDAHTEQDTELEKWPPHAMKGTEEAEIVRELAPAPGDLVIEKTTYSPFVSSHIDAQLEERGIIKGRVVLLDADKLGLDLTALIFVRTQSHDPQWLAEFRAAVSAFPEITSVWRMTGDLDYVLRARIGSVKAYDHLYQRLIAKLPIADVSASFVMEEIKETTALPI